MAFDEFILESFIWENTMRAADAVAPNLPYPPECLPVRDMKPLARSKCRRRRRRGTPPRHDADCGSQWRFLRWRACARPRILGGIEIWRIDDLITLKLYRNGCIITPEQTLYAVLVGGANGDGAWRGLVTIGESTDPRVIAKYFLGRGAPQVRGDAMRRRQTARNAMPSTIRRYFSCRRVVKRADAAHCDARNPVIVFFGWKPAVFCCSVKQKKRLRARMRHNARRRRV